MPSRFGVTIDSADPDSRKSLAQELLDLFRTLADKINVFARARRTLRRRALPVIAVMTNQRPVAAMISQRDVAVRTFDRVAA